jgi:phosphoribosylglycinamide formyltransferase 2
MNREGIRRLAAETLDLPTSPFRFADTLDELRAAVKEIGLPCVIKPVMSSSGKGQSRIDRADQIEAAWAYANAGGRVALGRVIVERFIDFEYEITLLTVRALAADGSIATHLCEPVGHVQVAGDYVESWQPHPMQPAALALAREFASRVTAELGGTGIFGVELFVRGDRVWFSEVSPRPHDTGMVTMITQWQNEFELHARAILGLPVPVIEQRGPSASAAILVEGESDRVTFENVDGVLAVPGVQLRLFGKPEVRGRRRMGVALATGHDIADARAKARMAAAGIKPRLE